VELTWHAETLLPPMCKAEASRGEKMCWMTFLSTFQDLQF